MMSFNDSLENDHQSMLNSNEFGTICLNNRSGQTFNIIKTDSFVQIDSEGLPISSEKPMFNTSLKVYDNDVLVDIDIKQNDTLLIETVTYKVFDIRKDGIGGLDIYLKD